MKSKGNGKNHYKIPTKPEAVVEEDLTLFTCNGKKLPPGTLNNVTGFVSPEQIMLKLPVKPTYTPVVIDAKSSPSLGVIVNADEPCSPSTSTSPSTFTALPSMSPLIKKASYCSPPTMF